MALAAIAAMPGSAFAGLGIVPGSRYASGRAVGMGNVYIPFAEDPVTALFYQPAAIGHIPKSNLEPLNLSLRLNDGYFSTIDASFTKVSSLKAFEPHLEGHEGTWMG
ncbi:MAG TPA: hypothetical protein VL588_03000, partial [Bdellovibrionota bacterium]|nr:hypothetical protein [Bdellovibrionota bacterium]